MTRTRHKVCNGISYLSCFCPPARPDGVVGALPAGRSRFPSLGGPLPGSLCDVRAPPGASVIARPLTDRRDTACTLHPRRDRAVAEVTGVIAVSSVIAGIVLLGPVRAARTVAKGAVLPVSSRAGRDRRDPSRLSRPHGGHGSTAGAVIAKGPCLP
jgi:hypothetical protein